MKNNRTLLRAEYLRKILYYDPETGMFTWRVPTCRIRIGDVAGSYDKSTGYLKIGITLDGKLCKFYAHRLAWLYVYGVWPAGGLDHIDRNRINNEIINLREATQGENNINQKKRTNCSSIYIGVSWYKSSNRWVSEIKTDGKRNIIGYFKDEKDAAIAYNLAALSRNLKFNSLNKIA